MYISYSLIPCTPLGVTHGNLSLDFDVVKVHNFDNYTGIGNGCSAMKGVILISYSKYIHTYGYYSHGHTF